MLTLELLIIIGIVFDVFSREAQNSLVQCVLQKPPLPKSPKLKYDLSSL